MSKILFIRHGQASFMKRDYDQLSELGLEQARQLGLFFKSQGININQAYSGTLLRQQQTAQACLKAMDIELEVQHHHGYNEHEGPGIVKVFYPEKFHMNKELDPKHFEQYRREFYGAYFKLAIPWANGELNQPKLEKIESWASFKSRFTDALRHTMDNCPSGSTVAIFTSGGPVGAAAGEVLGLSDEKTISLGWQVKNASFSEYLYSKGKISMVSFNETPHLLQDGMQTLV